MKEVQGPTIRSSALPDLLELMKARLVLGSNAMPLASPPRATLLPLLFHFTGETIRTTARVPSAVTVSTLPFHFVSFFHNGCSLRSQMIADGPLPIGRLRNAMPTS